MEIRVRLKEEVGGGKRTICLFHQNPVLAKRVGFVIRKEIRCPKKSVKLAELIGVILGDGGLPGNHQLKISFNSKTDQEYSSYLVGLLKHLFSINCYVHPRKNCNGSDIVVSSSNLVEFLLKRGLVAGNKVRNQVAVPGWIHERLSYEIACLRGLMDTDGGVYLHKYNSNGKAYEYLKLCFANCSKPLLYFVVTILTKLNYNAYLQGSHVSIYSTSGVKRYFKEIGSNNQKHINRFKKFYNN